ncbi:MAG: hypothetical protein QG632_126 [Candidatus Dependentiae bacterium]|nr:hypothetical protein [Candidatus Dependentiae bacterium]
MFKRYFSLFFSGFFAVVSSNLFAADSPRLQSPVIPESLLVSYRVIKDIRVPVSLSNSERSDESVVAVDSGEYQCVAITFENTDPAVSVEVSNDTLREILNNSESLMGRLLSDAELSFLESRYPRQNVNGQNPCSIFRWIPLFIGFSMVTAGIVLQTYSEIDTAAGMLGFFGFCLSACSILSCWRSHRRSRLVVNPCADVDFSISREKQMLFRLEPGASLTLNIAMKLVEVNHDTEVPSSDGSDSYEE